MGCPISYIIPKLNGVTAFRGVGGLKANMHCEGPSTKPAALRKGRHLATPPLWSRASDHAAVFLAWCAFIAFNAVMTFGAVSFFRNRSEDRLKLRSSH